MGLRYYLVIFLVFGLMEARHLIVRYKGIYLSQKEVRSHTEVGNKWLFRGLKQPNIIWIQTCNVPTLHNN